METDDLFANLEVETDSGDFSNNDQIQILNTLEMYMWKQSLLK